MFTPTATMTAEPDAGQSSATAEKTCYGGWEVGTVLYRSESSTLYAAKPAESPEHWPMDYVLKTSSDGHPCDQLVREAVVLAGVHHEHLITVLDAQLEESPNYLILPLLSGQTAANLLLNRGPLDPPHAVWIVRQTVMALAELHCRNWAHGDVKPDNVIVGPTGHATLLDLGFACKLNAQFSAHRKSRSAAYIGEEFRGSLAYAAPETVLSANRYEAASDIYSVGVMLFELVTGRLPFERSTPAELLEAHATQVPPDARHYRPGTPVALASLISRMLAKQPLRRPTTTELVDELTHVEIETFCVRCA